jgi:hypothetical protein
MKRSLSSVLVVGTTLVALLGVLFVACDSQSGQEGASGSQVLARIEGEQIVPLVAERELRALFVEDYILTPGAAKYDAVGDLLPTLDEVHLQRFGPQYYAIGRGELGGNCYTTALPLTRTGDNLLSKPDPNLTPKNSCRGNGCSSCGFTTDASGKITGCICNKVVAEGGYCDHVIIED